MSDTLTVLPADTPVADILDAAADAMARHGKCEGDFTDDQGRVCALGALRLVLLGSPAPGSQPPERDSWTAYIDASVVLHRHLEDALPGESAAIYEWNDASTTEEVVAAMRAAAERARAAQQ